VKSSAWRTAHIPRTLWNITPGDRTGEFVIVTELLQGAVIPKDLDATKRMIVAYAEWRTSTVSKWFTGI
jgi:hypothetical protein